MRYFASVTIEGAPVALYRFDNEALIEHVHRDGVWVDSENTIAKALVFGTTEYEELTEADARELFPAAFAVADKE